MSVRGHRAGLVTPTIVASRSVRSRRAAEAMAVPDPRERSQSSGVHSRTQSFESGATIATRRRAAAKLCLPHCFSPRRCRSCLFLLPQGGITVREPFQQATFGHDAGMPGSGIQRASRHPSIKHRLGGCAPRGVSPAWHAAKPPRVSDTLPRSDMHVRRRLRQPGVQAGTTQHHTKVRGRRRAGAGLAAGAGRALGCGRRHDGHGSDGSRHECRGARR